MNIPLLIIVGILIIYLIISYFYIKVVYLKENKDAESIKKHKKLYTIITFIFAFLIVSKFAVEQQIKDLSFDSAFIIQNLIQPILEQKTLTIEIILSFLVFIVYLIVNNLIPLILKKSGGITVKKFLKIYYNPKIIYNILPENKVRNCIYSKVRKNEKESVVDLIDIFKSLYISKKVYLDSSRNENIEISKRVFDFEKDIIEDDKDFVLLGDAGCGKSTLLFKTYIDIIEDNPQEKKIIPLFIDLKNVKDGHGLIDEIIDVNINLFSKIETFKYFIMTNPIEEIRKSFAKVFKKLAKQQYKFIFLFDSLDECVQTQSFDRELKPFIDSLDCQGESCIDYKFVIALRTSAYAIRKEELKGLGDYSVYKVRDYDEAEIILYIDKLVAQGKISLEDIDNIYRNIDIVTFDEKVIPFIVSMIVNGYIKKTRRETKTKVVEILEDNIKRLIMDVNENRIESFKYNQHTYELIGMTTLFKKTNIFNLSFADYASFISSNRALSDYDKECDILQNNTYLVDSNGYFYQKIFGDYYGASYLLNTIENQNNLTNKDYIAILDQIFTNNSYQELFEYLILLTDNQEQSLNYSPLAKLIDYVFTKYNNQPDKNLEYVIFEKFKIMLKTLSKYSTKKIIKDQLPLEIKATNNADEVTLWLYKKYFTFLKENDLDIDYGYFYNIVSIIDKHDLAIKAAISLDVDENTIDTMLSIIRDSYMNLNYVDKPILCFNEFNFTKSEIDRINLIICKNKETNKLSLRELLNLSFYNNYVLDYNDLSINIDKLLFPTIYNLDLFIVNYNKVKENKSIKVTNKDKLVYDCEKEYLSIKFLEIDSLNSNKISLKEDVITLYLYANEAKELSSNIKNTENIRSIDVDEGIQVLQENCFNKSINLRNIILPKTLIDVKDFALYECHHLQNLSLPDNITNLGESFIEDCFNLKKVSLPSKLNTIGQYAFEDDTSLQQIDFKQADVDLTDGLFKGCMSIISISQLNFSLNLRQIPKQLFLECINLKEADLSVFNNLEVIGNYAFARCKSLESIILPNSLKHLGMLVFYQCVNLKEIVFNSLPNISKLALSGLTHDIKIIVNVNGKTHEKVVNSNIKFMNFMRDLHCSFNEDEFINEIVFESKEDGSYILDYCFAEEIKEFKVADFANMKITSCNIGALGNLELLNDVCFDENLLSLSEWLFEDCYSLYTVNLEKTKVELLNKHIFENCYCLKEVLLPNTLKEIADYAFENCYELNRITFANKTVVSHVLSIPSHVERIGEFAFHNVGGIKKIIIESNNTKISSFAFAGLSNLEEVEFSDNYDINNIENNAFANCGTNTNEGTKIKVNGLTNAQAKRIFDGE